MNQNVKKRTVLIVIIILSAISGVVHVFNVKTLNNLSRKKMNLLEKDKRVKSELEDLQIQKQKLLAQSRIEEIATEKLGLVPNKEVNEKIIVDGRELRHIKKIIKSEYE